MSHTSKMERLIGSSNGSKKKKGHRISLPHGFIDPERRKDEKEPFPFPLLFVVGHPVLSGLRPLVHPMNPAVNTRAEI